jgi:hypothetical protein
MTLQRFHADVTSAKFPFNFAELSSTVILADSRELARSTPPGFSGQEAEQQAAVCQAYYMENVLPIARGYSSVHFSPAIPEIPDINGTIQKQYTLIGSGLGIAWLVLTEYSQYLYDAATQVWSELMLVDNPYSEIFVANVQGNTYILVSKGALYQYDYGTKSIIEVTAKGIDIGNIAGMLGVGNYVILWDDFGTVFNSSSLDSLDFVPDLATGAGSLKVTAITTEIVTAESLGDSFIIYTRNNAVAARSTGDIQFPFVFSEIIASDGIVKRDHIAYDTNAGVHICWTGKAFQQVTVEQAQYIWPELRDGISRGLDIKLNALTEQPEVGYIASFDLRLQFCTNNFMCVSLRTPADTTFKQAYVYDRTLQRWGRLVVDHNFIIDNPIVPVSGIYTYGDLEGDYPTYGAIDEAVPAKIYFDIESKVTLGSAQTGTSLGIVTSVGALFNAALSESRNFEGNLTGINAALPRIFFGKYKLTRDLGMQLTGVILNKLHNGRLVAHRHLYSGAYAGKDDTAYEVLEQPNFWNLISSADSVSLEINGTFTVTDILMQAISAGGNFQFGVPQRKKFYNYIATVPYPVDVVEEITSSYSVTSAKLMPARQASEMTSAYEVLSIDVRNMVNNQSPAPDDFMASGYELLSGTIVQTYFPVNFTQYVDDRLSTDYNPLSGTLVQTYFPLSHTAYPDDFITASYSILSGTLS